MPDDEPQRILIGLDWRSTGLAVGIIAAVIFAAWTAWALLSWLFGTTMGRAVLGLAVLATALYVILTDDFDPDDALKRGSEDADEPGDSENDDEFEFGDSDLKEGGDDE